VRIDHIAVRGLDSAAADAAIAGLRLELARALAETSALPARSQRTPVLKLAPVPLQPANAGARQLGITVAAAIARNVGPGRVPTKNGGSG